MRSRFQNALDYLAGYQGHPDERETDECGCIDFMTNPQGENVGVTISMPQLMATDGRKLARKRHQTFSKLMRGVLEKEIDQDKKAEA